MEKAKPSQKQSLTQIPEAIDPGIILPLYEEELHSNDPSQPQKLGSYRVRAGRFSNTLSNLLPSISAKLHHSRKTTSGTSKHAPDAALSGSSSEDASRSQISLSRQITPPEATALSSVDSSQLGGPLPEDTASFFAPLGARNSGDSFSFSAANNGIHPSNPLSRTRNNTVSSQVTSLSGMPQTAGSLWSTNTSPNEQHVLSSTNAMNTASFSAASPGNEYSSNTYFDVKTVGNPPNNSSSLTVPAPANGNIWGARQRSHSNASSIYTDAPVYDNIGVNRSRASTFGLGLDQPQIILNNAPPARQHSPPTPAVADDIDPRSINWVTTDPTVPAINQISTLLPTNTVSISNVYSLQQQQPQLSNAINLTSTSLATLCLKFGNVISARTLKRINMAIVEFDSVESAMRAKEALHGKEVSLVGAPSCVSFAKVLPMHQQSMSSNQPIASGPGVSGPQSLLQEQLYNGAVTLQQQGNISVPVLGGCTRSQQQQPQMQNLQQNVSSSHSTNTGANHSTTNQNSSSHSTAEKEHCPFPLPPPRVSEYTQALEDTVNSFGTSHDSTQTRHVVNNAIKCSGTSDTADFGPLPDPLPNREFDAPKLREIRKAIDGNMMTELEIEQLAITMLDELPELCSDYLGNTIAQKLFEHSSTVIKDIMLRQTNTFLTSMGVHKNGTWACQKIITMADTPRQKALVAKGVEKYCTPLFNDQFGNYVIQCVLKFGFPWNNFIFEHIISNFWTIAQNRYGARAVRACLEAHDIITREQLLVLSAMIVLYSEYLATNSNGALLVTWFLDTCTLPHRHTILAPKLVSNLAELCCHRLASLTVLKLLNYRGDEKAKRFILESLFGKKDNTTVPQILYQVLSDSNYGPTFVYKVLSMSLLEGDIRVHVVQQVRKVLMEITTSQNHRRLMDEVGLGGGAVSSTVTNSSSTGSKHRPSISHVFNMDNTGHMRNVSVGSAMSGGSRPRALSNSGLSAMPLSNPNTNGIVSGQVPPQAQQMAVPGGYYNYPGVFPVSSSNRGYSVNGDDLASQFEMLGLQNNTQISLPQLSMNNSNTNNNGIQNNNHLQTGNSNNGSIYGAYGY